MLRCIALYRHRLYAASDFLLPSLPLLLSATLILLLCWLTGWFWHLIISFPLHIQQFILRLYIYIYIYFDPFCKNYILLANCTISFFGQHFFNHYMTSKNHTTIYHQFTVHPPTYIWVIFRTIGRRTTTVGCFYTHLNFIHILNHDISIIILTHPSYIDLVVHSTEYFNFCGFPTQVIVHILSCFIWNLHGTVLNLKHYLVIYILLFYLTYVINLYTSYMNQRS